MLITPVVRVVGVAVLFAAIFSFAPLWLRGGLLGGFLGVVMNMADLRDKKIRYYEQRLKSRLRNENND